MGTNYYLTERAPCEHCGRGDHRIHIGKSSAGWHFALHGIPERGLMDLESWRALFERAHKIEDEYGVALSPGEMLSIITNRSRDKPPGWSPELFDLNGLGYLVRARLDGNRCVSHGEGTWDVIVGEFS